MSCANEREFCDQAPDTLQRYCRRTCGTCIGIGAPTTARPTTAMPTTMAPATASPTRPPPPPPPLTDGAPVILRAGNCEVDGYEAMADRDGCRAAAAALGLDDTTARALSRGDRPHGCYYKASNANNRQLYFNSDGDRTSNDLARPSICVLSGEPGAGGCRDVYNRAFTPWGDFESCSAEREFCAQSPNTLQRYCRRTCGTCVAEPEPTPPPTPAPIRSPMPTPPPASAPPTPSLPPASTPTSWRRHAGTHCHQGIGGYGGAMIDPQSSPVATRVDAATCERLCEGTAGCAGVVLAVADYTWTTHTDASCYDGAGATDLTLPSAPGPEDCYNMALPECQTQCVLTEGCTGIVWAASGDDIGTCCARSDIRLSECDSGDGEWNTYTLARGTGSGDCWRLSAVDIVRCP